MFDYESAAGQVFMKDTYNRLKSYEWTDTGIKFTIPNIKKEIDLGKYDCDVDIGSSYEQNAIEIKNIFGECCIFFENCYNFNNLILHFFCFGCMFKQ